MTLEQERMKAVLDANPALVNEILEAVRRHDRAVETLNLKCNLDLFLIGPDGEVKDERRCHNLITTAGLTALALATGGKKLGDFSFLSIGTGTTAANIADTALETEASRASATVTNPTATSIKVSITFAAGTGTGAITEAGCLSAPTGGTLLNRQVFSAVNKGASDSLQVNYTFTIAGG